jgi:hypothetical protein
MMAGEQGGDDSELLKLESQLLDRLDGRILQAEEKEMMDRYDAIIRVAEEENTETNVMVPQNNNRSDTIIRGGDDIANKRRRKVLRDEDTWSDMDDEKPKCIDLDTNSTKNVKGLIQSIEGLEYVRATKLIPRYLSKRLNKSRKDIESNFEKSFRKREGSSLQPVYLMGFGVRLESASPNSWRLVVTGFREATDLFLQSLERRFRTGIQQEATSAN